MDDTVSEAEFAERMERFRIYLERVLIWRWNVPQEAQDFAQDAIVMLLGRFRRGFRPVNDDHLRANLYLAARTVALNFFQSRKITTSESKNGNRKSCKGKVHVFSVIPLEDFHGGANTENRILASITIEQLMSQLTEGQRVAIQACTLDGQNSFEFADILAIPRTSVTGRIAAAMKAMKKSAVGKSNHERMNIARRGWKTRTHLSA